jgi:hypothetical protein
MMSTPLDRPAEPSAGFSAHRERTWGLLGGAVGALAGTGSFAISWLVPGVSLNQLTALPYPPFFSSGVMLALDYYFLALVLVGLAFLAVALVYLRTGRYPRTDGYGAALVGAILSGLGGVVLFMRVWAIAHR